MERVKRPRKGNGLRPKGNMSFPHPTHTGAESKYFPSWGEMLDFVDSFAGCGQGASVRTGDYYTKEWAGTDNFDEALDLAWNGWPEGLEKIKQVSGPIIDKVTSLMQVDHVNYDIEGIALDVATFLNGEPECWMRFDSTIEENHNNHVRIVVNITVSAGIDAKVITARGAAVAALVQGLELGGKRVQLEALMLSDSTKFETRVLVKAADQELDMSRVAFALAHPSSLRRIGFATLEGCPTQDNNYGYGTPGDTPDKGDIYVGSALLGSVQWTNTAKAAEWVIGEMKKQHVKMEEANYA